MGSWEEAEATDGRERRPRPLEGSLLSAVDPVEVLAEEECLRLSLEGELLPVASAPDGSHTISSLNGGSMPNAKLK